MQIPADDLADDGCSGEEHCPTEDHHAGFFDTGEFFRFHTEGGEEAVGDHAAEQQDISEQVECGLCALAQDEDQHAGQCDEDAGGLVPGGPDMKEEDGDQQRDDRYGGDDRPAFGSSGQRDPPVFTKEIDDRVKQSQHQRGFEIFAPEADFEKAEFDQDQEQDRCQCETPAEQLQRCGGVRGFFGEHEAQPEHDFGNDLQNDPFNTSALIHRLLRGLVWHKLF